MVAVINKRQQARNERALQDLISGVPGNELCADCRAKNPGWASWSLGIFLCMRCAALHRKLGTHISKVKSLSMDTWSVEQVENMKKVGNSLSNRTYNPRAIRPDLPTDPDEIDIAMEKFIRQKYQYRSLGTEQSYGTTSNNNNGNAGSIEDRPPPVPAKNTPRFAPAVRSASSNYPAAIADRPLPPLRDSNNIGQEAYEEKLTRLRDMGFLDDKRNLTLLKGLNGNVDRTIEVLVRLGGGDNSVRIKASTTTNGPLPPRTDSRGAPVNGLTSATAASSVPEIPPRGQSLNSTLTSGANQTAVTTTQNTTYNPFDVSASQNPTATQESALPPASMENLFQNLNVSQPPLAASNTGSWQAHNQYNPFLKSYTPPLSPSPFQNGTAGPYSGFAPDQMPQRSFSDQYANTNPFLRPSHSQTFASSNPFNQNRQAAGYLAEAYPGQLSGSPMPPVAPWAPSYRSASQPQLQPSQPFSPVAQLPNATAVLGKSPLQINMPISQAYLPMGAQQQQQNLFSESPYQSPGVHTPLSVGQQTPTEFPFYSQSNQLDSQTPLQQSHHQPQPLQNFQASSLVGSTPSQSQQAQQFVLPQATGQVPAVAQRFDKNSILALYNQPQATSASQSPQVAAPFFSNNEAPAGYTQAHVQAQSTNGVSAGPSQNPFMRLVSGHNSIGNHVREESKDFSSVALSSNANGGRYSPDAFNGLSSNFR